MAPSKKRKSTESNDSKSAIAKPQNKNNTRARSTSLKQQTQDSSQAGIMLNTSTPNNPFRAPVAPLPKRRGRPPKKSMATQAQVTPSAQVPVQVPAPAPMQAQVQAAPQSATPQAETEPPIDPALLNMTPLPPRFTSASVSAAASAPSEQRSDARTQGDGMTQQTPASATGNGIVSDGTMSSFNHFKHLSEQEWGRRAIEVDDSPLAKKVKLTAAAATAVDARENENNEGVVANTAPPSTELPAPGYEQDNNNHPSALKSPISHIDFSAAQAAHRRLVQEIENLRPDSGIGGNKDKDQIAAHQQIVQEINRAQAQEQPRAESIRVGDKDRDQIVAAQAAHQQIVQEFNRAQARSGNVTVSNRDRDQIVAAQAAHRRLVETLGNARVEGPGSVRRDDGGRDHAPIEGSAQMQNGVLGHMQAEYPTPRRNGALNHTQISPSPQKQNAGMSASEGGNNPEQLQHIMPAPPNLNHDFQNLAAQAIEASESFPLQMQRKKEFEAAALKRAENIRLAMPSTSLMPPLADRNEAVVDRDGVRYYFHDPPRRPSSASGSGSVAPVANMGVGMGGASGHEVSAFASAKPVVGVELGMGLSRLGVSASNDNEEHLNNEKPTATNALPPTAIPQTPAPNQNLTHPSFNAPLPTIELVVSSPRRESVSSHPSDNDDDDDNENENNTQKQQQHTSATLLTASNTRNPRRNNKNQQIQVSPSGSPNPKVWATLQPPRLNPLHPPSFTQQTIVRTPRRFNAMLAMPGGLYHPSAFASASPNMELQMHGGQLQMLNLRQQQLLAANANNGLLPVYTSLSLLQTRIHGLQTDLRSNHNYNNSDQYPDHPSCTTHLTTQLHSLLSARKIASSLQSYNLSLSPFTTRSPPSRFLAMQPPGTTLALHKLKVVSNFPTETRCHFCCPGMETDFGIQEFVGREDATVRGIWGAQGKMFCWECEKKLGLHWEREREKMIRARAQVVGEGCGVGNRGGGDMRMEGRVNEATPQITSPIDGMDITNYMPNQQCRTSSWRTLDPSKAQICSECKTKKLGIVRHGRHEEFITLHDLRARAVARERERDVACFSENGSNAFANGNRNRGNANANGSRNGRMNTNGGMNGNGNQRRRRTSTTWNGREKCMVCTGDARMRCRGCELLVCEGCASALKYLCKGWLNNLIYHYGVCHNRNDVFLLRSDGGGY